MYIVEFNQQILLHVHIFTVQKNKYLILSNPLTICHTSYTKTRHTIHIITVRLYNLNNKTNHSFFLNLTEDATTHVHT